MGFLDFCSRCRSSIWIVYLQCYFVTIATILGTGILGLPVTLSRTGLYPLLVHFIPSACIQILCVVFFANVLQRAVSVLRIKAIEDDEASEKVHFGQSAESSFSHSAISSHSDTEDRDGEDAVLVRPKTRRKANGKVRAIRPVPEVHINLHVLGEVYLSRPFQYAFSAYIILHEVTFMISYSLAGGEALQSLFGFSSMTPAMSVLVWVLNVIVIIFMVCIVSILSVLTLFKGSILTIAIIVVLVIGSDIRHSIETDFSYILDTVLMGSVALNGIFTSLPLLYNHLPKAMKFDPSQSGDDPGARGQVIGLVVSVSMGITTCFVLNVFWCLGMLNVVPQTCYGNGTNSCDTPNLFDAKASGEISTVPLVQVIRMTYPEYLWVADTVQTFILVSCVVSYLLYGAVLYQTVTGFMDSKLSSDSRICSIGWLPSRRVWSILATLFFFCIIYALAVANPKGFVTYLEKMGSFVASFLVLSFAYFMVWTVTYKLEYSDIPAPLSYKSWFVHIQCVIPAYFGFLCIYDVYATILEFI